MQKLFSNKLEMAKMFYNLIISYVRKLRAFNFHEPDDKLRETDPLKIPEYLSDLFDRIKINKNVSIIKLEKLSKAMKYSYDRLKYKNEND